MRHIARIGWALAVVMGSLGLEACGPMGSSGEALDWGSLGLQMPPAIEASELPEPESAGAQLVVTYCAQCHGIPYPASHGAADWTPTVRRMLGRMAHSSMMGPGMGMMGRMPMGMHGANVPTSAEADTILRYLQRHALAVLSETDVPEPGTVDAGLFLATCSRCHALPSPNQHSPEEWAAVVARMRQHMRELQVPEISDADAASIVGYLERAVVAER